MAVYIGTKVVMAEPVEKDGKSGYAVAYEDGYVSWSPKETFDRAYRLLTDREAAMIQVSFAPALQMLTDPP